MKVFFKKVRHIFSTSALFLKSDHDLDTWKKFTKLTISEQGGRIKISPNSLPIRINDMDPEIHEPLEIFCLNQL